MMMLIEKVLPPEDCRRVREGLEAAAWRDGKATAGPAARAVKANLQAPGADPSIQALERFCADALDRHKMFHHAARPKRLSRLLFSRYEAGMAYGRHVDDALMGPRDDRLRADVAFTLFLAEPDTYEGGALVVESPLGEQAVRLAAGDAVVYPAGTIHRVEAVTRGARLACVGWAESFIRDPAQREVLFDLARAREEGDMLALDRVASQLLRMWAG
jgi:PKHD-type hydroxylase